MNTKYKSITRYKINTKQFTQAIKQTLNSSQTQVIKQTLVSSQAQDIQQA